MIKEAVVETIQQVEHAIANGANRIELCDNLTVGGYNAKYWYGRNRYRNMS